MATAFASRRRREAMTLCEQIPSRSYLRRARHRRTAALYSVPATRFLHGWLPQSFFTPRVKLELTKLPPDKSATSKSLAAVGVSGSHTRVHTNATHITHITHILHTHITHTCNTYYKHPPIPFKGGNRLCLFTSSIPPLPTFTSPFPARSRELGPILGP